MAKTSEIKKKNMHKIIATVCLKMLMRSCKTWMLTACYFFSLRSHYPICWSSTATLRNRIGLRPSFSLALGCRICASKFGRSRLFQPRQVGDRSKDTNHIAAGNRYEDAVFYSCLCCIPATIQLYVSLRPQCSAVLCSSTVC